MVSSIRFSGLASGLDTQSIVDQLMMVERLPLNRLYKKKQLLEWKRDDYRTMNTLLKELDDFIFNGVYRKANLVAKTVTSSNTEFVTATANADAGNVSYRIENVKLATAARKISNNEISGDSKIDPSKSIWSQLDKFKNKSEFDSIFTSDKMEKVEKTFTVPKNGNRVFYLSKFAVKDNEIIKINGEEFKIKTISSSETSITPPGEKEVLINLETGQMIIGAGIELNPGTTVEVSYESRYLEFDVKVYDENGNPQYTNFKIDASTSLNSLISKINSSNAGVNLFYDSSTDKVVAMRAKTGDFNPNGDEISFVTVKRDANGVVVEETGEARFFTTVLGLDKDEEGTGTDAEFTINGLKTTRKSNTFTINGVTFTLKKNTYVGDDGNGNSIYTQEYATININTDVDSIVKTIKDFVNKYNEIIEKINSKLNEEKYRKYEPLTEEEKEALSEKEIEKWEEKARSGLLRRDSLLTSALDKLRMNLYAEVVSNERTLTDKKYNQLSEIGITTTSKYLERGKLEIDEDKLRAAIEENPNAIYQLFMADGDTNSEKGLARRLRETISNTIGAIEERAGNAYRSASQYTMGKQLLDMEDQITRFESRLEDIEQRYWKQYTAMEKALQKLNEQTNMLYSYLGMGSK